MKKWALIGLALAIAIISSTPCISQNGGEGIIKGSFDTKEFDGEYAYLFNLKSGTGLLDSVAIKDGSFELPFTPVRGGKGLYKVVLGAYHIPFVPEKGTISIEPEFYFPYGTPINDEFMTLCKVVESLEKQEVEVASETFRLGKAFFLKYKDKPVGLYGLFVCVAAFSRADVGDQNDLWELAKQSEEAFADYDIF